jgi:hypothetical protein
MAEQYSKYFIMPSLRSEMEGIPIMRVCCGDISTTRKKNFNHIRQSITNGLGERMITSRNFKQRRAYRMALRVV